MHSEATMTPLQELILQAVRSAGGAWLSRLDIAQRIGRPGRLNPLDIRYLDEMVESGLVEGSTRLRGPIKTERIYRAKAEQRLAGDVVPIPYAPEDEE